jgi:hypothetical protein
LTRWQALLLLLVAATSVRCARGEDTVGVVTHHDGGDAEVCVAGPSLKHRPEGSPLTLVAGMFDATSDGSWPLKRRDEYATLQGQGYLSLRWQIEYTLRAGLIEPPSFQVGRGLFLHVGGGGGRNLGDPKPETSGTWLGNAEDGLSYFAAGVPTPWQNEFYYLDGEVTITVRETDGLYNVLLSAQTYDQVVSPGWGIYNPGVVCDPE